MAIDRMRYQLWQLPERNGHLVAVVEQGRHAALIAPGEKLH
ncbi:MAG TPA: hypothetical protein VFG00_08895 [Acidothermaceae bacterium]|nr:hypothetical protein [Acidothermaceae bacterium]